MTNYDSAIELADRLRTTINTAGWQDIIEFMNNRKGYYTNIALTSKDMNEILYAQACVMAIDDILSEINALINVGDEAEKRKKNQERRIIKS